MQYDRQITISAAGNRRALRWPAQTLWWSEFVQRLATAARGQETLAEYLQMKKSQQDDLKDVGGFVGGLLAEGRRKGKAVQGRDLITLDLDAIPSMGAEAVLKHLEALTCAYVVYSTRKHEPTRPRLRAIFPLSRTVTADEYEPIARMMGKLVGIEHCDPTTFQAVRMMYWPSCCADTQHIYHYADKPFLDADAILAQYADWHDAGQWPQVPSVQAVTQRLLKKQEDPTTKHGVVGAFCKVYNVYQAMEAFLPGIYEPVDTGDGRYTFTGGSTTGGAVVYDSGLFLYSHHATDPCSGQLVNAFDMVRLHLHGMLDDDADIKDNTPTNRYPSYVKMCEAALADEAVKLALQQERYEKAFDDFNVPAADTNWMVNLQTNKFGDPLKLRENATMILQNDPLLAGCVGYDEFADRVTVIKPLPWDVKLTERRRWADVDDQQLRCYMEKVYRFDSPGKLLDAFAAVTRQNAFNDVQEYLNGLLWDGVPRLDMLLIDYLNAEDTPYTRTVTRKIFVAAVARAMTPGTKFDFSVILVGKQGKGKSTLLRFMGGRWFLEDLPAALDGKEASERIQGYWLAEMGELNGLTRSEVNITKQFLSRTTDVYRQPYGRHTAEYPRRCVIFGSTNDDEFLRDSTGNRRFWPVTLLDTPGRLNVFTDLAGNVDQIWAEAKARFACGEPLFLPAGIEADAVKKQEQYRVSDAKTGLVAEFLERPIPDDWDDRSISARRIYWAGEFQRTDVQEGVQRQSVCAAEIWCECFGQDKGRMRQSDTREINGILKQLGWIPVGVKRVGPYGPQRSCLRVTVEV